jgi:trans-2,3-dihydro-3-hydroxyanthranilate isomerase
MPTYPFYQLDVFTTQPLAGNALAVFHDPEGLDAPTMQALAREMNLSETTFVFPSDRATRRVRFFTPTAEIPLAGHPTIGTWWALASLGRLRFETDGEHEVTQETDAGVLPVYIRTEGGRPTRVVMVQAKPNFLERVEDRPALAAALGGGPDLIPDGTAPQVVSTALPQLMVPVQSLEALRAVPSGGSGSGLAELLRSYGTDCVMCFTPEVESPQATVHCRMFAPGLGVPEDPATGSAAGALGAYLVEYGMVSPAAGVAEIVVEQGIEISRPSTIHVTVRVDSGSHPVEVRVGGEAVAVVEGEVTI